MKKTTKITRWGNSQGIRLPKEVLKRLSINIGDNLSINVSNRKIILSPIKNELKFANLFANYEGETKIKEYWNDTRIGKEEM